MIRVDKQDEAYLSSRFRLISFLYKREREKGREGGREEGKKSKCLAKVM